MTTIVRIAGGLSRRLLLATALACGSRARRPGPGRDQGPGDHRAGRSRRRLRPARPVDAGGAPGQAAGGGRAGPEHPGRRRHDRPRPVRHQGLAQPQPARGRARHGRGDRDQQVAGHARPGAAAGAADRRVSAPGGCSGLADQVGGRPAGAVQGRPGLGELGRLRAGQPRPHPVRADRQGGRRRRRQDELHRRRCRRRDAGAGHGRPPHRRDRRPQRDGAADPDRQAAGDRHLLARAAAGRRHPDLQGAGCRRDTGQLARADGAGKDARRRQGGARRRRWAKWSRATSGRRCSRNAAGSTCTSRPRNSPTFLGPERVTDRGHLCGISG